MTRSEAYANLGLAPGAPDEVVRAAYRSAVFWCHPDRNPDNKVAEETFRRVCDAYELLRRDAESRASRGRPAEPRAPAAPATPAEPTPPPEVTAEAAASVEPPRPSAQARHAAAEYRAATRAAATQPAPERTAAARAAAGRAAAERAGRREAAERAAAERTIAALNGAVATQRRARYVAVAAAAALAVLWLAREHAVRAVVSAATAPPSAGRPAQELSDRLLLGNDRTRAARDRRAAPDPAPFAEPPPAEARSRPAEAALVAPEPPVAPTAPSADVPALPTTP